MRRTRGLTAVALAAGLLSGCAAAGATPGVDATPHVDVETVPVLRQDLTRTERLTGRLTYAGARPLVAGRDGTLTALPGEGTVIGRGEVLSEIDGVATRLLHGRRPAWRRMELSWSPADRGRDLRQLNDNLAALGYAERDELPGARFDWRTWRAVRRWQADLGVPETGVIEHGDVEFFRRKVRMGRAEAHVGTRVGAGQTLALVTDTEQVVTLDLDVALRDVVEEGLPVVVALPDRSEIPAKVRSVGRVASAAPDAGRSPTVEVEVGLAAAVTMLDATPVTVHVERVLAEDALLVPVGALVALTGGGYAVERVTDDGTELVPVEPGDDADGLVAVTGGITAGDEVVVPS